MEAHMHDCDAPTWIESDSFDIGLSVALNFKKNPVWRPKHGLWE